MRAVRAADESQPTSVARRVSRFVLLPILAGIALYLTQGIPQYLGREGGTPPHETYWSDTWWILADVVYVATLSVALYVRRVRRISGDWAMFVALSAALTYT